MGKLKQTTTRGIKFLRRANQFLLTTPKNKRLFYMGFICTCIVSQVWVFDSWIFGQLTNKLVGQKSVFGTMGLALVVVIYFVSDLVPSFMRYVTRLIEIKFRFVSTSETQRLYWRSYLKFDIQDRENPKMQDSLANASNNQGAVQELFYTQWTILVSALTVVVAAITLGTIQWWYFFAVIIMVAPRIYFMRTRRNREYTQDKRLNEIRRYKGAIEQYVGTKESLINDSRTHYFKLFDSVRHRLQLLNNMSSRYFASLNLWTNNWYFAVYAVLIYSLSKMVLNHEMVIGSMFMLFTAINRLYSELDLATTKIIELEVSLKKAEDFFLVIDSVPAVFDVENATLVDDTVAPKIEFDDVYFKYPESEQWVLQGVSFTINPGEAIGLIAKNGEGKTTIGLLMLRFYDATKGSIRINGTDIRLIKRQSLLKITGALFQDFATLKTTLKGSLMAVKPGKECSDAQLWSVLEKVGLKEYAEKLPNQLDHKVDRIFKDSVKLSGGQNQKLALAGLLYRDPKLVILDEFTSALDPEAEQEIILQYKKVIQAKTALIISHRYLSLKIVDKIVVLHDGKIIETGTKNDLLQIEGGIFKRLYKAAEIANSLS